MSYNGYLNLITMQSFVTSQTDLFALQVCVSPLPLQRMASMGCRTETESGPAE